MGPRQEAAKAKRKRKGKKRGKDGGKDGKGCKWKSALILSS